MPMNQRPGRMIGRRASDPKPERPSNLIKVDQHASPASTQSSEEPWSLLAFLALSGGLGVGLLLRSLP